MFEGARAAVEESCDRWFILSAQHGLVDPDEVLEPYDKTLKTTSRRDRRRWSDRVVEELTEVLHQLGGSTFEIHAGKDYYAHGLVDGLRNVGAEVEIPVEGLSPGHRRSYYRSGERHGPVVRSKTRPRNREEPTSAEPPTCKYRPLWEHLLSLTVDRWGAKFTDVEAVLGFTLPTTAGSYQAWWANERYGTHSHARAWMAAGFRTENLHLDKERVTFVRSD